MTRDVREIFADIDSFDPQRFVAHLTDDVVFRFGNAGAVVGTAAVREGVAGFFSTIDGLTHHLIDIWEPEPGVTITRFEVEYRRKDGETVYIPNVDVLRWRGERIYDWQIFIDITPIYAPISEVPAAALHPSAPLHT